MNNPTTEDWGYDDVIAVDFEGEGTDEDVNILHYLVCFDLKRFYDFIGFAEDSCSAGYELNC